MNINKSLVFGILSTLFAIPVAFTLGISTVRQVNAAGLPTITNISCPTVYRTGPDGHPTNGSHCTSGDTSYCQVEMTSLRKIQSSNQVGCFLGPTLGSLCCINAPIKHPTPTKTPVKKPVKIKGVHIF